MHTTPPFSQASVQNACEKWCSGRDGGWKRLAQLAPSQIIMVEQCWHPVARSLTWLTCLFSLFSFFFPFQQFGKILDVEIIFNERGSKVEITLDFIAIAHTKLICRNLTAVVLLSYLPFFSPASVYLLAGLWFCNIWVECWCREGQREATRYAGGRT